MAIIGLKKIKKKVKSRIGKGLRAAKGFGKKLNTTQNVKICKITLFALGVVGVALIYQPSRHILVTAIMNVKLAGVKLKSTLIPPRDETSELTEVEESNESISKVPKWLEKVGTGLVIIVIGAAVCKSQGVSVPFFNTPETTSKDIESESTIIKISSGSKGTKNNLTLLETIAALLTYPGIFLIFKGMYTYYSYPMIYAGEAMVLTAWQILGYVSRKSYLDS